MSSRPVTPAHDAHSANIIYQTTPPPTNAAAPSSRPSSYGGSGAPGKSSTIGYDAAQGAPVESSYLSQSAEQQEDHLDANHIPDTIDARGAPAPEVPRPESRLSQTQSQPQSQAPSRGGTLKKKSSIKRSGSLIKTLSRRSSYAGSVKSVKAAEKEKVSPEDPNSVFYSPVPTQGHPTEILANRFQAWRKVLKDLITYFRDVQRSHEGRSKALLSAGSIINNTLVPSAFLASGGLGEAVGIIRDYNKQSLAEGSKAKDIENEIILQLTGLRSDLQQKIKEIKSLSGDFKSSVDKESEGTKRAVRSLQEALGSVEHNTAASAGKGDPYIVKMGVERQVERLIEEENYLHRAYLNLESSGRELESIVVGEIQKAYTAYSNILKREADEAYEASTKLREGPLAMGKDFEWEHFVTHSNQMVDPKLPVRAAVNITYPGKDNPSVLEVRSGMLERKSKYLKNYTPGWYVLSPTHLHEYKSADRIAMQSPIMSLFLPEQKLGTHSEPGSSSHKFMMKGRQTGGLHRGHTWIFRAESHDTMIQWFGDLKELTEKTGEQRNEFVRRSHARSLSGNSLKPASVAGSSDAGMEEDEADKVPYSTEQSIRGGSVAAGTGTGAAVVTGDALAYDEDDARSEAGWRPPQRPSPGGRFPSDVNLERGLQAPLSPSSGESFEGDRAIIAAAGALPGSENPYSPNGDIGSVQATPTKPSKHDVVGSAAPLSTSDNVEHPTLMPAFGESDAGQHYAGNGIYAADWRAPPVQGDWRAPPVQSEWQAPPAQGDWRAPPVESEWKAPAAVGVGATVLGISAIYEQHQDHQANQEPLVHEQHEEEDEEEVPEMHETQEIQPEPLSTIKPADVAADAPIPVSTILSPSLGDSPTHTHAPSSSQDTGSLSTVPTTIEQNYTPQVNHVPNPEVFDPTIVLGATDTKSDTATSKTVTPQMNQFDARGMRPATTSANSISTISDLHVPGEFPRNLPAE